MEAGIFIASIFVYAVIYFVAKFVARGVLKADSSAIKPRLVGLASIIVSAVAIAVWARFNLIKPSVFDTLSAFDQGRYVGQVIGAFLFPAVVSAIVILFRIWRAGKSNKSRALEEKRRNRPSPQW